MASRVTGALIRAALMIGVVSTPALLLSPSPVDTFRMSLLVAAFAGLMTFVEYNARAPSLTEFRDAPPFNRMRALMLFSTLFTLSMLAKNQTEPTALSGFIQALGSVIGGSLDFPYSPVRLVILLLEDNASEAEIGILREAAGLAFLIAFVFVMHFWFMLRLGSWPRRGIPFNVWVNLPTFDPTAGPDVVRRLERDALINLCLAILSPFLIPLIILLGYSHLDGSSLTAPHTLTWTMTAWSFLPASLLMRGLAMQRIAEMITYARHIRSKGGDEQTLRESWRPF